MTSLHFSSGGGLQFQMNPKTHFVDEIVSSRGDRIHYQYEDQNLTQVSSNKGFVWKYSYDELHNLTEVYTKNPNQRIFNFKILETVAYDTGRDRVLTYQGANHCSDQFIYLPAKKLESTTILQRECPGRSLEILKYHFQFTKNQDGTTSLTALSVKSRSGTTAFRFNQRTGEQQRLTPASIGGLQ